MEIESDGDATSYSDDSESSYEDDDELQGLNFDSKKESRYEEPYVVLGADQFFSKFDSMKENFSSLTKLPKSVFAIVSEQFRWNSEEMYDDFCKYSTPQEFLSDKNILQLHPMNENKGACIICCEDDKNLVSFSCLHPFCRNCWEINLKNKINDKQWKIKCMQRNCDYLLSEDIVESLISDKALFKDYQLLAVESFIQVNDLVKFCPGVDCGRIVFANFPECYGVKCTCGELFCMKCDVGNHDPITCDRLKRWTKLSGEDNESLKWLQINTRPCPNCNKPIEKDGGCNHITCSNGCNYQFCWLCMKAWTLIHDCNRVDTNTSMDADLEVFTHYNRRYMNHSKSLKLEGKLKKIVNSKIQELREIYEFTDAEIKFLEKAVLILSECRRALMYSYSFAFFIEKNNQKDIFEENQSRLEVAVEQLSGLLENEFACGNTKIKQWKQSIIDFSKNVDKQRSNLLGHVLENDRKQQWQYKESV